MQQGRAGYWTSPEGIDNRVMQLAQVFTYRLYNGAMRLAADQLKGVTWLIWITAADDRVCLICNPRHGKRWRKNWFMPRIPAHPNCRCQWELEYE